MDQDDKQQTQDSDNEQPVADQTSEEGQKINVEVHSDGGNDGSKQSDENSDSSSPPPEATGQPPQEESGAEPHPAAGAASVNQPYVPSPGADNFASSSNSDEAGTDSMPTDSTPADNSTENTAPTESPSEPANVETTPSQSVTEERPPVQAPEESATSETIDEKPVSEEAITKDDRPTPPVDTSGQATPVASPAVGETPAEVKKDTAKGLKRLLVETEKSVLISVMTVTIAVLAIVLYFLLFYGGRADFAEYRSYSTYQGTLASLNLETENSYVLDYPIAMQEDTGTSSSISNWFLASDSTLGDNGKTLINSIIDFKIVTQSSQSVTKDQELAALDDQTVIKALINDFAKDLSDRFGVSSTNFTFVGTTKVGVDNDDGYVFDFSGVSADPNDESSNLTIKGRYVVGFSNEARFTLAMLARDEYWQAGIDEGTWDAVVNSIDIN